MADRTIEYESENDTGDYDYYEIDVEMDSDETPSGPFSYGGGRVYWFGVIAGMRKSVKDDGQNNGWEDVDLKGEWFKANEKDIQAHVDGCVDDDD